MKLCILILMLFYVEERYAADFYTASVLEHVFAEEEGKDTVAVIKENLAIYTEKAGEAAKAGADIIVFPESGMYPEPRDSYQNNKDYFEIVPDPKMTPAWNPCVQNPKPIFGKTPNPILTTLSCIAKDKNIYVVGHIDEKACSGNDKACPSDSADSFYGTSVVFDKTGNLVARHRNRCAYFLGGNYTLPATPDFSVFNTSFGSFGVLSGYELLFGDAVQLIEKQKVDNIVYSTWWEDELPSLAAIQFIQGWALAHKVNVLAANNHDAENSTIGSIIASGTHGALNYTFEPEEEKSQLVIAKVPLNSAYTPKIEDIKLSSESIDDYYYREIVMDNYTLVELKKPEGTVTGCNNGLCCNLTYKAITPPNNFFLAVYSGMAYYNESKPDEINSFCLETCLLIVCDNGSKCDGFPANSEVAFESASIKADIKSKNQYPVLQASEMRLVARSKWEFGPGKIALIPGKVKDSLLSMGILGRCYEKDPIFKQP